MTKGGIPILILVSAPILCTSDSLPLESTRHSVLRTSISSRLKNDSSPWNQLIGWIRPNPSLHLANMVRRRCRSRDGRTPNRSTGYLRNETIAEPWFNDPLPTGFLSFMRWRVRPGFYKPGLSKRRRAISKMERRGWYISHQLAVFTCRDLATGVLRIRADAPGSHRADLGKLLNPQD
jgi:hypothetical protein